MDDPSIRADGTAPGIVPGGPRLMPDPLRVLVVEDDPVIGTNLRDFLAAAGHQVVLTEDGETGYQRAAAECFDVIVLDRMLPRLAGIDVCRRLRQEAAVTTPVLMLTARDTLEEKLEGFACGADDYVTKPFALREIGARVQALVKRRALAEVPAQAARTIGHLRYDSQSRQVQFRGNAVRLAPKLLALLDALFAKPGSIVSREELEQRVWGAAQANGDSLRTHMHVLRRSLIAAGRYDPVETVHGFGYRLRSGADA